MLIFITALLEYLLFHELLFSQAELLFNKVIGAKMLNGWRKWTQPQQAGLWGGARMWSEVLWVIFL